MDGSSNRFLQSSFAYELKGTAHLSVIRQDLDVQGGIRPVAALPPPPPLPGCRRSRGPSLLTALDRTLESEYTALNFPKYGAVC